MEQVFDGGSAKRKTATVFGDEITNTELRRPAILPVI